MRTALIQLSDRVRLKPGSGNYKLYVGYRDLIGEVEFVGLTNAKLRAAITFPNRQRLMAVPVEDLQHA
jgi:hypothetical protein